MYASKIRVRIKSVLNCVQTNALDVERLHLLVVIVVIVIVIVIVATLISHAFNAYIYLTIIVVVIIILFFFIFHNACRVLPFWGPGAGVGNNLPSL